jgi:excisionase family DNA binding protein
VTTLSSSCTTEDPGLARAGLDDFPLTTGQAGRQVGTSDRQVRRWIDHGRLRAVRTPGGRYRVRLDDLMALYAVVNGDAGGKA